MICSNVGDDADDLVREDDEDVADEQGSCS